MQCTIVASKRGMADSACLAISCLGRGCRTASVAVSAICFIAIFAGMCKML
jgi:hypothetical protein